MRPAIRVRFVSWAFALLAGVSMVSARAWASPAAGNREIFAQQATIRQQAGEILQALKSGDFKKFAALVHPVKGVRFSPYANVDKSGDRVFTAKQVEAFAQSRKKYTWGAYDGSGSPIRLTPKKYFKRFVYDRDFSNADKVSLNDDQAASTTANNAADEYPGAARVEYFFETSEKEGARVSPWEALRLVLEPYQGKWVLVGVIHDEWTI